MSLASLSRVYIWKNHLFAPCVVGPSLVCLFARSLQSAQCRLLGSTALYSSPRHTLYFTALHSTSLHSTSLLLQVICAELHRASDMLVVGFSNGVFGLYEMPDFNNIHTLSVSQHRITTTAINSSGEWLAFGCASLGQLLVWEWQSETCVNLITHRFLAPMWTCALLRLLRARSLCLWRNLLQTRTKACVHKITRCASVVARASLHVHESVHALHRRLQMQPTPS